MNVSFRDLQREYIDAQVSSGGFQNASEVVRDALRLHKVYRYKILEDIKLEIEKGWAGPDSKRSVKDIIVSKQK